jgi:hypothetical protein
MISVEQVSDARELARYQSEWTDLVSGLAGASIFDTYEWVTAWLDCFWKNKPIYFLFFRNEQSLVGIAPLLKDREGELWCAKTLVSPINCHSRRANIICGLNPALLFEALFTHLQNGHQCRPLTFLRTLSDGPLALNLPEIANRHHKSVLLIDEPPSPIIRLTSDWETYQKSRSRHLAKEVRRKVKRFENAGHGERRIAQSADQCDQAIADVMRIERNSWKENAGTSLTADPNFCRFYRDLAATAARNGWLRLYLLYLDSVPVAYVYGIVFQNQYYALKTSFDENYRELSPGVVLFDHVFRDTFASGLEVFDLLGVESRWKTECANDQREHVTVCVFDRFSVRCQCCRLYELNIKPFVKRRMPFVVWLKERLKAFRIK